MKYTDFDELFWFSDPESMGRVISEKYNLTDFYNADLNVILFERVFCPEKEQATPTLEMQKLNQFNPSF